MLRDEPRLTGCLVCLLALSGVVAAGEGAVPELAAVRTMGELEAAAAHRLPSGWVVRLGLGEPGELAGPWKLLYCHATYEGGGDPSFRINGELHAQILGQVFYTVTDPKRGRRRAIARKAFVVAAPQRTALYCVIVPMAWSGAYRVRVLSPKGKVLAERIVRVERPRPCHWAQFATSREGPAKEGEAAWLPRREAWAAVPAFGESASMLAFDRRLEAGAPPKHKQPLPGIVPLEPPWAWRMLGNRIAERRQGEPLCQLLLAREGAAYVVRGALPMLAWPDITLLARWWVNGKAVVPPRSDEHEMIQLGRVARFATEMKVALGFPAFLGELNPGDRVGLQVLYSPGTIQQLPRTRAAEGEMLKAMANLRRDAAPMPLLSNRLDLTLTDAMLELARRRGARWETDF